MMKFNKLALVFFIALLALFTAACGGGTAASKEASTGGEAADQGEKVALPDEGPTFICKVKEIIGNEVTVYKAQAQSTGQNQGQAQGQNPAQSQNPRSQGGGARFSFSGETETFLIPVGTPIVTMQRGVGTVSQVGLADIKKDTVLMIWKEDDIVTFVQLAGGSGTRQGGGVAGIGARQGVGAGTGAGTGIGAGAGGFAPGAGGFTPGAGGGNR